MPRIQCWPARLIVGHSEWFLSVSALFRHLLAPLFSKNTEASVPSLETTDYVSNLWPGNECKSRPINGVRRWLFAAFCHFLATLISPHRLHLDLLPLQEPTNYVSHLRPVSELESRPFEGVCLGLISETLGEGVDAGVATAVRAAAAHYEQLGATVEEVPIRLCLSVSINCG
jgi:hypothetical protein